ncbi:GOLPH3/VPS74 family protein [Streptomyces antarcticus]|uniref:GOLPH3/VPS74 family protein n=1 Tax=Streptomyces antarcticus TaxID=2996458 RepID=UPI0022712744|nr:MULTISPECIES: GPP34 family phosphoprotein [unclassified Streptomyces]MCY0942087.1 GPP34 family phosphoprotein [Streptomyces sp. H34-AA3]MCZ4081877.1 GPP34 family phosphoprotein [Streptomyces sp. H34-S5]
MAITLAEEIMLLSLDDESGSAKQREAAGWAVAGGILLELVLTGRVSVTGRFLELKDTTPTGERLLDSRTALIETWLRGRGKRRVTDWLTKDQPKAVAAALESLCERGVVTEERRKALGVFPVRRYPEADGAIEGELRARLRAVVLDGAEPDARTASLIALIHSAKLHRLAFPGTDRKQVAARMAEVATGQWAAESVRNAIRDMQLAMIAVTVAVVGS